MNFGNGQEENVNVLEKYGRDIVDAAKNNKIDPVIGRDEEIRSITRILSRKTKNNPVLIGEPGVGRHDPGYPREPDLHRRSPLRRGSF